MELWEKKEVSKHVYKEDFVTVWFHVGFLTKSGETKYYSGLTNKKCGDSQQQIPCITIGLFDEIVYSTESLEGNCGCFNF